jgi:aspartate aminotransferase
MSSPIEPAPGQHGQGAGQRGPRISRRVAAIAESATLAIDARAKALKAMGEDVIAFGAGEPDFPTPAHVVEAAAAATHQPRFHHYTPTAGLPELREAVAAKTARDSGYRVEPAQVLVTNGGKQAIYEAFATLLDPGDEVLVPAPYWVTYPEAIALAGGVPVFVPTGASTGFRTGVERLEAARTPRTKVLLFVSPSNPTGAVYPREEIEAIGGWAAEHGLWVLTDEIYEHLVYGGNRFHSLPALVPEQAERTVVVNGVAKTYAMTGWRVGWMLGPADVVKAAANLQSHATSNVCNVAQAAALAAVSGPLDEAMRMREAFDRRRRRIHELLAAIPGVTCMEPQGAFYAFPSVSGVLGRRIHGRRPETAMELADLILEEARVAIVPGEAFGAPGYARLSYALGDDDLMEGITRIAKLLREAA